MGSSSLILLMPCGISSSMQNSIELVPLMRCADILLKKQNVSCKIELTHHAFMIYFSVSLLSLSHQLFMLNVGAVGGMHPESQIFLLMGETSYLDRRVLGMALDTTG
jgi:hypothetical protein